MGLVEEYGSKKRGRRARNDAAGQEPGSGADAGGMALKDFGDGWSAQEAGCFFADGLLAWYRSHQRDLPWRRSKDPYRVWVSEIMLQQTRVDTVIPYYQRFMERFPTLQALAEAPEEEVLKRWEGLGYYSRARNLQAGAREVVARYGGAVPDDKAAVAGLKGVGPYTAGAIMSIAFNRPEPAVDGNVMRVLSRYFLLQDDIAKPRTRIGIEQLAASLIPDGAAGDFNQALMEHGALTCTPKSPGCLVCPVMAHCAGRLAGMETVLPLKTKAKPPRPELRLAALIEGAGAQAGKVLVRRRPDTGLLARMWELPHVLGPAASGTAQGAAPAEAESAAASALPLSEPGVRERAEVTPLAAERMAVLGRGLAEEQRLLIRPRGWWMEAEHVFSHIVWDVQVYLADFGFMLDAAEAEAAAGAAEDAAGVGLTALAAAERPLPYFAGGDPPGGGDAPANPQLPENYRWIGPEDMQTLAFPNVFLRILRGYWEART